MKTVKFYRQHGGHVARVTDDEAEMVVVEGRGMYCPKRWWKAAKAAEADFAAERAMGDQP